MRKLGTALVVAALATVVAATACGSAGSDRLQVYFGYADSGAAPHQKPAAGTYPTPWEGASGVNFVGQGPQYDAGAIRVENPSGNAVKVDRATVDVGEKHYDLWGSNLTVPAHGSLVLTQTQMNPQAGPTGQPTIEPNFDTSEKTAAPGNSTPSRPILHLTVNGKTTDIRDEHKVLTNNGRDLGSENGNPNESREWVAAGTVEVEGRSSGVNVGAIGLAGLLIALLSFLPALIGGLLLLLVGWFLARWAARLVAFLLARAGLDTAFERLGLLPAALHGPRHDSAVRAAHPHRGSLAWLLGVLVGVFVFLVFAIAAVDAFHLQMLAALLGQFLNWIPNLFIAIVLLALGLLAARWLAGVVGAAADSAGLPGAMLAMVVRVLVILIAAVAAAEHLGVAGNLVNLLFAGLCVAVALAAGLAFGLGGQDTARQLIERWSGRRQLG